MLMQPNQIVNLEMEAAARRLRPSARRSLLISRWRAAHRMRKVDAQYSWLALPSVTMKSKCHVASAAAQV